MFLIDVKKALLWYLTLYAITALLGFYRVIHYDKIILPLMLLIGTYREIAGILKSGVVYIIFLAYILFITFINGLPIIDDYSSGAYFLVVILAFSEHLYKRPDYLIKTLTLIWLITIAMSINSILFGSNPFEISEIAFNERSMELQNTFKGGEESEIKIDLNYFGSSQAIGAIITLYLIVYWRKLTRIISIPIFIYRIITKRYFNIFLYILFLFEIWLVIKGLSRGAILVLFFGLLTFIIIQRKFIYLLYLGIFGIFVYLYIDHIGIIDLYLARIENDESGLSGRNSIWLGMIQATLNQGGILQLFFGGGNGWDWWNHWSGNTWDSGTRISSHNQILSLLINFGILGISLFSFPIIKNTILNLKIKNPLNDLKIILLSTVLIMSLSLEPLVFAPYTWFILSFTIVNHNYLTAKIPSQKEIK